MPQRLEPWWHSLRSRIRPSQNRSRMLRIVLNQVCDGQSSGRHSCIGDTLPYLICGLEARGIPYQITALPGKGYMIQGHPEWGAPVLQAEADLSDPRNFS